MAKRPSTSCGWARGSGSSGSLRAGDAKVRGGPPAPESPWARSSAPTTSRPRPELPDGYANLIYIDPPFNTGNARQRKRMRDHRGSRAATAPGSRASATAPSPSIQPATTIVSTTTRRSSCRASSEAHRLLAADGSFFLHIDCREVHYCKVLLDGIFGRDVLHERDHLGLRLRGPYRSERWSAKHDNILWYAKDPKHYIFNFEAMDRIPYMAPGLVATGEGGAAARRRPTSGGTRSSARPARRRPATRRRSRSASSSASSRCTRDPGDLVLDFFAGSGTTGEAAARHGRDFWLCDNNPEAVEIMRKRLGLEATA